MALTDEEAALRAAVHTSNGSGDNAASSRLSMATASTDYESAVSHVTDTEDDAGNNDVATNDHHVIANSDNESVSTLQRQTDDDQGPQELQQEHDHQHDYDDTQSGVTSFTVDNAAGTSHVTEDLHMVRTLSHTRSVKSLTDTKSIYGPPVGPFNPSQNQSEAFDLALQKTLSRKSILAGQRQPSEDEGVDPRTLDWDSPEDKDNPKNWSSLKKWAITMVTASICLEVTFGSSLYVCGVPDLMLKMGISQELGLSGLTFYLLGLAFGPALCAPLSELFGRRIVYISSLPISMLFTMGVGLANNIQTILVLRFFAGFFSSPAMAVAGGTIADIWDFDMMGIAMAGFCLAPFMGPVLGPVIGGFVVEKKGWKWTMWVNLMFAGMILVPVLLTPETYKPAILKARAQKRNVKLAKPPGTLWDFLKVIFFITLMTPVKMLFFEPIVMVFSIYIAFVFAVLFGFFEAYPIIFRGVYGFSLGISGLTFLGILIGFVLGTAFFIYLDRFIWFKKNADGTRGRRDDEGNLIIDAPETRLILAKVGAVCLPVALFWLGWSSRESVHWICPVIAGIPFGAGLLLIFFCVIMYFSMSYPPLSLASSLAANNLLRYVLASIFPLFTVQMYKRLHIGWASSLFGFISLALLPVPWIFEKWGPQLRMRSQYGYSAMMKNQEQQNVQLAEKFEQENSASSTDERLEV